ncbi:MAG: hypothetical protein ACLP01_10270 [Solirubrobacteraceae bacterium]
MGFSDKLKQLKQQAQEAVAENKDKIHEAVEVVSVGADQKTHGKYTAKIAKFGQKASDAVDKFGGDAAGQAGDAAGAAQDPSAAAPPAGEHVAPAPEAGMGSPSSADAAPAPSGPSFDDAAPAPPGPSFDDAAPAPSADAKPAGPVLDDGPHFS